MPAEGGETRAEIAKPATPENDHDCKHPSSEAALSNSMADSSAITHPRTGARYSQNKPEQSQSRLSQSADERREFVRKQKDQKKTRKRRHDAEARVNKLIADCDACELFSEKELEQAYDAEEREKGIGTLAIRKLPVHQSSEGDPA